MNTDFITDLMVMLEELLHTRVEQVHLKVSQNPDSFPGYAAFNSEILAAHDRFEAGHPNLIGQVDDILNLESMRQDEIVREIYWQGVRDCLTMMKHLKAEDSDSQPSPRQPQLRNLSSPYRFVTSDRRLERFFHAHNVSYISQQTVDGKLHWTYPWSPEVVRLLDEYNAIMPFEGVEISNEDAH